MDDNNIETNGRRRSFLELLPSTDDKKMTKRTSIIGNSNDTPKDAPKRGSVFGDSSEKETPKPERKSFTQNMPVEEKKTEPTVAPKPRSSSFVDSMPATPSKPKEPVKTVREGPRDSLFKGKENPLVRQAMKFIEATYPEYHREHFRRIESLVEKLLPPTISMVMDWGQNAVEAQQELVNQTTLLVKEFNSMNGDQLLDDIIKSAGYQSEKTLFGKLKNTFNNNKVDYVAQVEGLKVHLQGIMPSLDTQYEKSKDTQLPLWMVAISGVDEVFKTDDAALAQVLADRRQLLNHAFMNVNTSKNQLEQVRLMAVKLTTQIAHVMNVTIPALMRNQK